MLTIAKKLLLIILPLCLSINVTNGFHTALSDSSWIQTNTGCKIYNPNPIRKETITWTGDCVDGYASGKGTLTWYIKGVKTEQFIGSLKKGILSGPGKAILDDRTILEGLFKNNKLNGRGKITKLSNGEISETYTGDIVDGEPYGHGTQVYYDSGDTTTMYIGEFSNSNWHGKGKMFLYRKNGYFMYEGEFKESNYQGSGVMQRVIKGEVQYYFKGNFKGGSKTGYGEERIGMNVYKGEWSQNKKNGNGTLIFDSTLVYTGQWVNNEFEGIGKRYFPNGTHYVGQFKKGHANGLGVLNYVPGVKYVGEFKNGLFHGQGYLIQYHAQTLSGYWENGSLDLEEDYIGIRDFILKKKKSLIKQFDPTL